MSGWARVTAYTDVPVRSGGARSRGGLRRSRGGGEPVIQGHDVLLAQSTRTRTANSNVEDAVLIEHVVVQQRVRGLSARPIAGGGSGIVSCRAGKVLGRRDIRSQHSAVLNTDDAGGMRFRGCPAGC